MRRLKSMATPLAFVLAFGVAAAVEAAPIVGTLSKTGCDLPVNSAGTLVNSNLATGINFTDLTNGDCVADAYGDPGTFGINAATGSFSVLNGSTGQIKDFQFGGAYPISSFEVLGAGGLFTFTATSIQNLVQSYNATTQIGLITFELLGTFTSTIAGLDATPGIGVFTLNQAGAAGGGLSTFTFSSSQIALAPVPEPASLMLLGTGLFGAASAFRRRRAAGRA